MARWADYLNESLTDPGTPANDYVTTYSYDTNGSQTNMSKSQGGNTIISAYEWDLRNRMKGSSVPGSSGMVNTVYVYDHEGMKVRRSVGNTRTIYTVDKNNPTGYPQIIEERTPPAGTVPTELTAPTRSYVIGNTVEAQSDAANGTLTFLRDGHGSNRAVLNLAGNVVESYSYQAFGEPIGFNPDTAKTIHLHGGDSEYDSASKLQYHDARWRSGNRFTSYDSFEAGSEDPLFLHKYSYANSNPTLFNDPTGKFPNLSEMMTNMGVIMRQVGARAWAGYQVYDKADTIKDLTVFLHRFAVTGALDPIAGSLLLAQFLPFGKLLKSVKTSGNFVQNAGSALKQAYASAETLYGKNIAKISEFVGEIGAAAFAKAKQFTPTNFPRKYHGIEAIFEDASGRLVIVEAKGGAATLKGNQMSKAWIEQRIAELRRSTDPLERSWGDRLRAETRSNRLQGATVWTEVDHVSKSASQPEFELKDWSAIGLDRF